MAPFQLRAYQRLEPEPESDPTGIYFICFLCEIRTKINTATLQSVQGQKRRIRDLPWVIGIGSNPNDSNTQQIQQIQGPVFPGHTHPSLRFERKWCDDGMHVCLAVISAFPLHPLPLVYCTGNKCGLALIPVLIGTQYMRRASTQKEGNPIDERTC